MEMLNKLRSTVTQAVSQTVSQVSNVLPGNPVTREYEVQQHVASAGPGLLWRVYSAYKKSTREEASVFVLEKRQLEPWARRDREAMLDALRQGVGQLTRLRHPRVLTVQHPMEESRESLAFATEPVFASLANVLGRLENAPSPAPAALRDHRLHQVEIKYGLLQLGQALSFLHADVKMLHRNICPEAIVVNQAGAWKVAGLEFCVANQAPADQPPSWPVPEYDPDVHPLAQPSLAYACPEAALCLAYSPYSDMYSLAALAYSVFTGGGALFNCDADWYAYKKAMNELKRLPAGRLEPAPAELRDTLKMMLNVAPDLRPDAHQFCKIGYFDDVGVKTLNYLDSLFQWDNLQKSQFYKGLPQVIPKLPHRVCLHRIMPCLAKEFVNAAMIPFVLPNTMLIAENATKEEYSQHILPLLTPVMKIQEPIQILLIFMQRLELLLSKTPPAAVRTDVLPLMYRALESDTPRIQELCLSVLPRVGALVDYPSMKNALLPRIKTLCLHTQQLSTRVGCLVCLGKLLPQLDRWLVLDEVLPLLPQLPSREPAVIMAIVGIYKVTLSSEKLGMTKEVMAARVLPFLCPLAIENGLSVAQFDAVMALVRELVTRVESEHRHKLTQLNVMKDEQQKALDASLSAPAPGDLIKAPAPADDMDKIFGELGITEFASASVAAPSPPADGAPPASASRPLSMDEKQRRLRAQEAAARLSAQPALAAAPPGVGAGGRPAPRPRDLTESLISSNLNMMSTAPPPGALRPPPPAAGFSPQQRGGALNGAFAQQPTGPMLGAPGYGQMALPAPAAASLQQPTAGMGWSQNGAPIQRFGASPMSTSARPQGFSGQMGGFGSMGMGQPPMGLGQASMGMGHSAMGMGMSTPNYGQSPVASKPLSSNEINDFLK